MSINASKSTQSPIMAIFNDALDQRFEKVFGFPVPSTGYQPKNKGQHRIISQHSTKTTIDI